MLTESWSVEDIKWSSLSLNSYTLAWKNLPSIKIRGIHIFRGMGGNILYPGTLSSPWIRWTFGSSGFSRQDLDTLTTILLCISFKILNWDISLIFTCKASFAGLKQINFTNILNKKCAFWKEHLQKSVEKNKKYTYFEKYTSK